MSTAINAPTVEFSETGAIYCPGNGHAIEYRKVGGIFYHADTPDTVVWALEQARSCRRRVRLYYGDVATGRDWLEENDVTGYMGNSIGPLKVPLLVHNRRSHGGGALLDHCIIKVRWTTGGVLYQHPQYHNGPFTIREIGTAETCHGENLLEKGFTHSVDVDGKNHANFRSMVAASRYVHKMID
jgi:hypothetical protein